jgi:16S rRNA (cytosine967-C5)-methyltransferase
VPQRTALFRRGEFYIQDEASQIVAMLLQPLRPGDRLVDLCAAPGGKLLQVAGEAGAPLPFLVAADLSLARLRKLRDNARRAGIEGIHLLAMDAGLPALGGRFERVAVDAPCSGTGVIRRHPEIRWRVSPASIERHAERQARTLQAALDLLAPGGRLVYSVCSLEPEEGPARIDAILRERRDVRLLDARDILPGALHHLVHPRGMLETLPHRHGIDGFFAAVLSLC